MLRYAMRKHHAGAKGDVRFPASHPHRGTDYRRLLLATTRKFCVVQRLRQL